jgi:parvulin-like peptidyl-prolyl isomerase
MEDRKCAETLRSPFYTWRVTCYILLCLVFIAIPSSGLSQERILDYIVAVVNDQPITSRELETELLLIAIISNPLMILGEAENDLNIQEIKNPPDTVRRAVLEALIDQKLMLRQADDIGMMLWSWGKRVNIEIQALKALYRDEASFFVDLQRLGLEYQEIEERMKTDLIVNALTVRQFRNSIEEEKINQKAPQYFEQHRSEFIAPAQIQFQYILVRSRPDDTADLHAEAKGLAETISSRLKAGATFQDIQEAYPNHPLLRLQEEPQIVPIDTEIRQAIADLAVNEVSQPIPVPEGHLIAKLLKKEVHPRQQTYPEVSQEIQDKLIREELQNLRDAWLTEQKAAADIRILDAELKKIPLVLGAAQD